jgi:ribosomal-protein-alanine N-acetyltransferase
MGREPELRTDRLLLRRWRDSDRVPFAALNADPEVMQHFPGLLTRDESDALIDRIEQHFDEHGYGLWAVEVVEPANFIGFVGLQWATFETWFTPALETGWRLARHAWGHGYASEAARAAVSYGFDHAGVDEIVSFTVPANLRSQAVMTRIGLHRDASRDFGHPRFPPGHPIREHVLYCVSAAEWKAHRDRSHHDR